MKLARLADVCTIVSGATPKTGESRYWDGDVAWVTPAELGALEGKFIDRTERTITPEGLASCAAAVLPTGSVLLSSRAPIGHVAITGSPMATNQGFKSLIPKSELLDASYLYHWLRANKARLQAMGNGATFKELSKAVVERIELPLPELTEQRRVAAFLDQADALRAKRAQALTRLDDLTTSIFHDMFGDPLGVGASPVRMLADWVDPAAPITYGILMPGPDTSDGVPYIRVVDMAGGTVKTLQVRRTTAAIAQEYRRSELRSGDILMSIRGHVGRVAIVPPELDRANITQDTARIRVAGDSASYVSAVLQYPSVVRWMARRTKGVAVRGLNLGDLRLLPIPVPEPGAVARFADAVANVVATRDRANQHAESARLLAASLQAQAFRAGAQFEESP